MASLPKTIISNAMLLNMSRRFVRKALSPPNTPEISGSRATSLGGAGTI